MRESQEQSVFETVPTVVPGLDACVLWVPEKIIQTNSVLTPGTALKNFLPKASKGDALARGYGDFVLTQAGASGDGQRSFWFAKQRTSEEIATAWRSMTSIQQGLFWPPVLSTVAVANLLAYDANGVSYVAGTVWDFAWAKKEYRGPTKVLEEYFASHASFDITTPTTMQEMGGTFDYGVGSMTLPPCLHGALDLSFTLAESSRYPAQTFEKIFAATNVTTWPDTLVLEDDQQFSNGLYIRKRVTAYKPY